MSEYKPCPFCGSKASLQHEIWRGVEYSYVMCGKCKASSTKYKISTAHCSDLLAGTVWNQRIPESNVWHDPDEELPPVNTKVLIIADTPYADNRKLVATFANDVGWYISDINEREFIVRAWMSIPTWEGDNAAGDT